jgi:hypothetical protein
MARNQFAKRHYEPIAMAMQDARMHIRCNGIEQMECVVNILADLFAGDNGQFKRGLTYMSRHQKPRFGITSKKRKHNGVTDHV